MDTSSRKLHVADTLAKATRALEAHRSWMKRRAAAVTLVDLDDETDPLFTNNEYSTANVKASAGRYSGRPTTEHWDGNTEQNLHGAPPPFIDNQSTCGSVSEVSRRGATSPGLLEQNNSSAKKGKSLDFSDSVALNNHSHPSQTHTSEKGSVAAKLRVRRKLSQVAPTNNVDNSPQSPVSIEMFLKGDEEAELPPLTTTTRNAWGSQSTLEGFVHNFTNSMKQTPVPESSDSDSTLKLPSHLSNVLQKTDDSQSEMMRSHSPKSNVQVHPLNERETNNILEHCDSISYAGSVSNEDHQDLEASQSQENSFESAQIDELQANTPATVIPVCPAPVNQRSSYTAHTQSKLMAAEDNVELLNIHNGTRRQDIDQHDDVTCILSSKHGVRGDIPEAILHSVLPKQNQTGMESVKVMSRSPVISSSDSLLQPFDLDASGMNRGSGATSHSQISDVSPTEFTRSKSLPLVRSEASRDISRPAPYNLDAVASYSYDSEELSQKYHHATRVLNLPPLKRVEINGNIMVKELPPLKSLQSPLLSPLLNEHSLSQKRNRSPPAYIIHQSQGGLVLAPPCPMYGAVESSSLEALSSRSVTCDEIDSVFGSSVVPTNGSQNTSSAVEASSSDLNSKARRNILSLSNLKSKTHFEDGETIHGRRERTLSVSAVSSGGDCLSHSSIENHDIVVSQLPPGPGALHLAAKSGNLRLVHSLLYQGHDVDLPDHEGRTPLMYCIQSQGVHLSCADALIREGANVNKQTSDGFTAIHLAASVGAVSLIELMLLNGANPDIRDFEGRLPIHWATIQKGSKTISLLLKHSNSGVNVIDDAGMTPLMWAAYNNNSLLTSYLLDNGADCEEKDIDGYTAMHWAIHRESTRCLQLLLQPDRTYFKDHKGRTVFHLTVEKGAIEACELILKMRVDAIFDTDKTGRTPLHYAAACSRVDVCALLLDRGCDASQRDLTGRTPLDYARIKKLDYVVALLTCHGSAVADFARASRTTSVNTFLNHSVSFSELPHTSSQQSSEEDSSFLLSQSLSTLSVLKKRLVEESGESDIISQRSGASIMDSTTVAEDSGLNVTKEGYLGRFFVNSNDPVQHFYFWLKPSNGTLCWSRYRENASHTRNEANILEIHEGASNGVKQNPSYSPQDLHKYVFWVMTGSGVLDLFAYNQDAYSRWVNDIRDIAEKNALLGDQELFERNVHTRSRNSSRPASRRSNVSRSSVAPVLLHANSQESRSPPITSPVTPTALKPKQTEMKVQPPHRSVSCQQSSEERVGADIEVQQSNTEGFSRRRGISMQPAFTSTPLKSGKDDVTINSERCFVATNLNIHDDVPELALEESDVI